MGLKEGRGFSPAEIAAPALCWSRAPRSWAHQFVPVDFKFRRFKFFAESLFPRTGIVEWYVNDAFKVRRDFNLAAL